jgi:hypothetical protein
MLDLASLFVGHGLILGLFLVTVFGLGRRLLSRLSFANAWEEVAISAGIGCGALGTAVFLLGMTRLLYPGFLLTLVATCWLVAFPVWRDVAGRCQVAWSRLRPTSRSQWALASLAGLAALGLVVVLLVLPLYPPSLWDGISYHLASAKQYLREHRLFSADNFRFPVFPQLSEMLSMLVLGLVGDRAAQVAGVGVALLAAFSLIGWCRANAIPRAGVMAAAAWLGSPLVWVVASASYVDATQASFLTLFLHAFGAFIQRDDRRWLVVSGLFGGCAAAIKYTSVPFLVVPALVLLVRCLRRRQLRLVGVFALAIAVPASPWYLRNLIVTGNPVFPFASRIFGIEFLDEKDLATIAGDWDNTGQRDLKAAVTLPYRLAFQQKSFRAETPIPGYLFLLAPLGLAVAWRRGFVVATGATLLPYLALWFFNAQFLRYLVPTVPMLALFFGILADRALALLPRSLA